MTYYIQIGTTNYDDDRLLLRKAIGKLESRCQVTDGFLLGEPMSKFGWTFFDLLLKPNLHLSIDCLLYTSPSPRDLSTSRMPSSA